MDFRLDGLEAVGPSAEGLWGLGRGNVVLKKLVQRGKGFLDQIRGPIALLEVVLEGGDLLGKLAMHRTDSREPLGGGGANPGGALGWIDRPALVSRHPPA